MNDTEEDMIPKEEGETAEMRAAAYQLARAIWQVETKALSKAEKREAWTDSRKERLQHARKVLRKLGSRGITLNIPPQVDPEAEDD